MPDTLKPCPFCGASAISIGEDRTTKVYIACGADCECVPSTDWHEPAEAAAIWNIRHPDGEREALIEALEADNAALRRVVEDVVSGSSVGAPGTTPLRSKWARYPAHIYHRACATLNALSRNNGNG